MVENLHRNLFNVVREPAPLRPRELLGNAPPGPFQAGAHIAEPECREGGRFAVLAHVPLEPRALGRLIQVPLARHHVEPGAEVRRSVPDCDNSEFRWYMRYWGLLVLLLLFAYCDDATRSTFSPIPLPLDITITITCGTRKRARGA